MSEIDDPIEQYIHIAEMKEELHELSDGAMVMETCENMDQGIEEAFLENVLAYEHAEQVPFRELLERDGVILPAPNELSDDELPAKLDEVIQAMAKRRAFLECTDHLSDRELYTHLIEISLEETYPDLPPDDESNCHFDITGSGSEEDIEVYLKHYADDDCRAHWAEDWPDMVIPAHEDPPYDRDRHLPKPPPPRDPYEDPELAAAWCAECRDRLLVELAEKAIIHGNVGSEPVSYAPPAASVWAIESKDREGTVEWWALIGDCPYVLASAREISSPRAFLKAVSQQWQAEVDALEEARRQAEELEDERNKPPFRLDPFYPRQMYARMFQAWAADDSAWDDEWELLG